MLVFGSLTYSCQRDLLYASVARDNNNSRDEMKAAAVGWSSDDGPNPLLASCRRDSEFMYFYSEGR